MRSNTIFGKRFFSRDSSRVARELLGKHLIRMRKGRRTANMITDVEVYDGFKDRASHASRGRTERTKIMFGPPGHWYVYFTYGMHWMLNIVTREEGYPAAILIRGVEGISGPARITKALGIDGRLNGMPAEKKSGLWFEDRGIRIAKKKIGTAARIGVGYARPYWSRRRLRYFLKKD